MVAGDVRVLMWAADGFDDDGDGRVIYETERVGRAACRRRHLATFVHIADCDARHLKLQPGAQRWKTNSSSVCQSHNPHSPALESDLDYIHGQFSSWRPMRRAFSTIIVLERNK